MKKKSVRITQIFNKICVIVLILLGIITNISCGGLEIVTLPIIKQIIDGFTYFIDNTKPEVISFNPENNSDNVNPSLSEISILFSEPMQEGCWSISKCDDNIPNITGYPQFSSDRKEYAVNVHLNPNTTYKLCINTAKSSNCKFKDDSGNILNQVDWCFKTSGFDNISTYDENLTNNSILSEVKKEVLTDKNRLIYKCKDAAKLILEKGYENAKEIIVDHNGKYFTNDSYVFILSLDGMMKAHPVEPNLNNKQILNVRDKNGKRFLYDLVQIAIKEGSGWVKYSWPRMGEKKLSKKETFIYRVPNTNYAVCSGMYTD
jgi:hypothetical protein